jgi:hypothetical protein
VPYKVMSPWAKQNLDIDTDLFYPEFI